MEERPGVIHEVVSSQPGLFWDKNLVSFHPFFNSFLVSYIESTPKNLLLFVRIEKLNGWDEKAWFIHTQIFTFNEVFYCQKKGRRVVLRKYWCEFCYCSDIASLNSDKTEHRNLSIQQWTKNHFCIGRSVIPNKKENGDVLRQ